MSQPLRRPPRPPLTRHQVRGARTSLGTPGHGRTGPVHSTGGPLPTRPRFSPPSRCRTIYLLAIAYAVDQPRLRTRLTLGRLPLPRNPQACGVGRSQPQYATHSDIRASVRSTRAPARASPLLPNAPLPPVRLVPNRPAASAGGLSPVTFSARRHSTSELLRTLSRMAASKPTSWLSAHSYHLSHSAPSWGP